MSAVAELAGIYQEHYERYSQYRNAAAEAIKQANLAAVDAREAKAELKAAIAGLDDTVDLPTDTITVVTPAPGDGG